MTHTTDSTVSTEQLELDIATLAELKAATGDQRRVPIDSVGYELLQRYWPTVDWDREDRSDFERWAMLTYNDEDTLERLARPPFVSEDPSWCTTTRRGLRHAEDYDATDPSTDVTDHSSDAFTVAGKALTVSIERTDKRKDGVVTFGTPQIVVGGEVDYFDAATARAYGHALLDSAAALDRILAEEAGR